MNKDLIFLTKMLTLEFSDFAVFHCLKTTTTTFFERMLEIQRAETKTKGDPIKGNLIKGRFEAEAIIFLNT